MFCAVFGAALLVLSLAMTVPLARALRARGESGATAWRFFLRSGLTWFGVISLLAAVNATAAGVVMLAVLVVFGARLGADVVHGVRRFPAVWRRIGDPEAWRGRSAEASHRS